jgi:hypothetical protein
MKAELTIGLNRTRLTLTEEDFKTYDEIRKFNSDISELGFVETYPIGCHRYYTVVGAERKTLETIEYLSSLKESLGWEVEVKIAEKGDTNL